MPHFGQSPGLSDSTPGHIGQKYFAVADGVTGFLVGNVAEMAKAIGRTGEIDPEACRARARARFRLESMTTRHLELYERLIVKSMAGSMLAMGDR